MLVGAGNPDAPQYLLFLASSIFHEISSKINTFIVNKF